MVKQKPKKPAGKKSGTAMNPEHQDADSSSALFPVVGIGASAGGLDALEQFLGNVPEKSGMAYVVVQHLDPTQKGMLPELLQRVTRMSIYQAKDNMLVKPDCVYVIPPNKNMSILKGRLCLFPPTTTRGLRLPIDFFFRSLAEEREELAVGIILSGMGSDGSLGLSAIKEKNGIVMVQDPASAKFDSMPRSAIDSVPVDIIAPSGELPKKLLDFIRHIPLVKSNLEEEIRDKSGLGKILTILRAYTGNDFSQYKKSTIYRRIERRMSVHKMDKILSYAHFLQENQKEADILFKELLIGVTSFFRDEKVWEKLKSKVIPDMITSHSEGMELRAWVPACSTGEEVYSLAIVFQEALKNTNPPRHVSLKIFATDLDNDAIEIARRGFYPPNISADVSEERLNKFFIKTEDGFRVNKEIREMVIFAQHNLIMHPPFIKIDFLSCRNLMIYLDPELQKMILGLFYYSINDEGVLLLGSSETLGTLSHYFKPIDSRMKIYRRALNVQIPEPYTFPGSFALSSPETILKPIIPQPAESFQTLADQYLLQNFSPPGVLVNSNGDILYISGRTGKYLEPAAGKANMNIFAMLRDGIRASFQNAFHQAIRRKETIILQNLRVDANGVTQILNVTITWIGKPDPLKELVMIVFTDINETPQLKPEKKTSTRSSGNVRMEELEIELQNTREEMQNSIEELQASQEELRSANEELQSSNEELQSTNEELTSSKEEMQSLNEELQIVNAELQSKVDEYTRVDNDMKNLLDSIDIATIFLDKDLKIRRFTNQATKIFKLIKSDIGRPITDQVSDLDYPRMADDAREVLKTLVFRERQIPGNDGRWFFIRIMPYRTFDDRIDGLVITFIDISDLKLMEQKLKNAEQIQNSLFDSASDVIIRLSSSWKILEVNSEAEAFFGIKREDAVNKNYIQMFIPLQQRKKVEKEMERMMNEIQNGRFKAPVLTSEGSTVVVEWTVNVLLNNEKKATGVILLLKRY